MRGLSLLAALSLPLVALADCDNKGLLNGGRCRWYGDAPFCGGTLSRYGDFSYTGEKYVVSTRDYSAEQLRQFGYLSTECAVDYHGTCTTGYKRLWCYQAATVENEFTPFEEAVYGDQKGLQHANSRLFPAAHLREREIRAGIEGQK